VSVWTCLRVLLTLISVTCTMMNSHFHPSLCNVDWSNWAGYKWQKLLIQQPYRNCQPYHPQYKWNCSCFPTSVPFRLNHWPRCCWNLLCCLRCWSALPSHKWHTEKSRNKLINHNCCRESSACSYSRAWSEFCWTGRTSEDLTAPEWGTGGGWLYVQSFDLT